MTNLHTTSINVIRAGQAPSGAYLASPTFSQYRYSWLRDGTWIAYGMSQAGQHDSARAFHTWAGQTMLRHQVKVEQLLEKVTSGAVPDETDYLPTRFKVDGDPGTDFWWDFQLDGYGAWLWGLAEHCRSVDNTLWQSLRPAVRLTVDYLAALWQSPNYDCWEENRQHIHTSTLTALYGGLNAVRDLEPSLVPARLPETIRKFVLSECVARDGHFMKYLGNDAVDASLLWTAVPYGLVDIHDSRFVKTLEKIERDIHRQDGGVYRFAADTYYGGGEWVLLTAWLGWVYAQLGRVDEARAVKAWVEAQATPEGLLPEQVSQHLLDASRYAEWEVRWGTPACPLLWSHGMYLVLESVLEKTA